MIRNFLFAILTVSFFIGCSGSSRVSQIKLNDPDGGITATVNLASDGSFKREIKNGDVVAILSGNVDDVGDGKYKIGLNYERKTYTAASTFKSEKLKCEATAQANVEIPVGKNPAQQQTDSSKALEKLSIQLIAPEPTKGG
ncbi:MAG: hypothetical protein P8J33_15125 [Pirellulaceae bacterium]|nr:hypothetical protein [Pirellulaceae bacterium]